MSRQPSESEPLLSWTYDVEKRKDFEAIDFGFVLEQERRLKQESAGVEPALDDAQTTPS